MDLSRRTVIVTGASAVGAAMLGMPHITRAANPLQQPALPFAEGALAPAISAKTVGLHYGKHHKAYFDKLNGLVAGKKYADMDLQAIMMESAKSVSDTAIFNNAAQAWNHIAYWDQFKPGGPPAHRETYCLKLKRLSEATRVSLKRPWTLPTRFLAQAGSG